MTSLFWSYLLLPSDRVCDSGWCWLSSRCQPSIISLFPLSVLLFLFFYSFVCLFFFRWWYQFRLYLPTHLPSHNLVAPAACVCPPELFMWAYLIVSGTKKKRKALHGIVIGCSGWLQGSFFKNQRANPQFWTDKILGMLLIHKFSIHTGNSFCSYSDTTVLDVLT